MVKFRRTQHLIRRTPAGALGGLDEATAIIATAEVGGYWVASASAGISAHGDAPEHESIATRLNGAIIASTR